MRKNPVVCIGAALVDESFICNADPVQATSNPSRFYRSPGGVACNIAGHLGLLGHPVELISHFGNDPDGKWLMEQCQSNGVGISHSIVNDKDTGRYVAILSPAGELFVGAMSGHFENEVTPVFLRDKISLLKSASLLQIDCNLSAESLNWLLRFSREEKIPCIIEPVSIPKASRLLNSDIKDVLLITPNLEEMAAFAGETVEKNIDKLIDRILERGVKNLWVRNGKNGSSVYSSDNRFDLAAPRVNVVDITGAGDAALAGWMHAWLMKKNPEDCVRFGHSMAYLILQSKGAIQKNLTRELLERTFENYK